MAIDLDSKATKDLETIVANCERLKRTSDPLYAAANMEKTIATIRKHGRVRNFLSYKDIADASGLNWVKTRRGVGPHLEAVSHYATEQGWPNLTSIVVNKDKVDTGEMTKDNLKGFLEGVRNAGQDVDIEDVAFMKREQQRVFAWCREEH
jgi:5-methylcytosine-specific restriction protein B